MCLASHYCSQTERQLLTSSVHCLNIKTTSSICIWHFFLCIKYLDAIVLYIVILLNRHFFDLSVSKCIKYVDDMLAILETLSSVWHLITSILKSGTQFLALSDPAV